MAKAEHTSGRRFLGNGFKRASIAMAACILLIPLTGCDDAGKQTPSATGAKTNIIAESTPLSEPPYDPIQANGLVFEGWPTPQLALIISGEQRGYLEPCGCTGPGKQKGGVMRRHGFIQDLEKKGWPLVMLDMGGQLRRPGIQSIVKFSHAMKALFEIGYSAVALGKDDLAYLTGDNLLLQISETADNAPSMVQFANSAIPDIEGMTAATRIVEKGGRKIGVTSVLGKSFQAELGDAVAIIDPAEAIRSALAEFDSKECNLRVLLVNAEWKEALQLAEQFPQFDVVGGCTGYDEASLRETLVGEKTRVVDVGKKGMYLGVIAFFDDAKEPIRFQRVPLDSRWPESEAMQSRFKAYVDEVSNLYSQEAADINASVEGLGLWPALKHDRMEFGPTAGAFAGAASCKECHTKAYGKWALSKHAHATESIQKAVPSRIADPECIACHTTGWNPQSFAPYETGFVSLEKTPLLVGNSCENCHGPSQGHIDAEAGKDMETKQQWREMLKLTTATAEEKVCRKCHDLDNSPQFDFSKYWAQVAHPGKN